MINYLGPINSGAAVGANGSATSSALTTGLVNGKVTGVYIKYNDAPPAGTCTATIATANVNYPGQTVLSVVNAATSGWFFPRVAVHSNAGAAVTYDGTRPIYDAQPVHDQLKITISGVNAADNIDVYLLIED
jgi:hypothetical protein